MHAGARTGSITYSARAVDGGAGSNVTCAQRRSLHLFPHRSGGGVASDAGPTAGASAQSEHARCAKDYFPKMRDCATGIDGATWLLSGASKGITYNGSNSAESVGSVLDPNLRRKVIGSIHRRQRLVTHRRRTRAELQ